MDDHINLVANYFSQYKGNWAEAVVDVEWFEKGYTAIHKHKVTTLTDSHQGIDHIFWNPNTQKYAIVETKWHTQSLRITDGIKQLSDSWIKDGGKIDSRLIKAVDYDENLYDLVVDNYERVIAHVWPDGKITYKYVDSYGNPINYYPNL